VILDCCGIPTTEVGTISKDDIIGETTAPSSASTLAVSIAQI